MRGWFGASIAILAGSIISAAPAAESPSFPISFSIALTAPSAAEYQRLLPAEARLRELENEQHAHHDLLFRSHLRFHADGTAEETIERARLFLTQAGVQNAGNSAFSFDAFDTRAVLVHAHTLLPDGRVVSIGRKDVMVDPEANDHVFSGEVGVMLPFQALAPRAISVARIRFVHDARKKPIPWAAVYRPETFSPLERFELVVEWDDERVRPVWKSNHVRLTEKSLGPSSVSFTLERAPGLPDEPDRESDDDLLPELVVAQRTTWRELSSSLASIYRRQASGGPGLQKKLGEILGPEDSPLEKAKKIQRFVTGTIRYVGLERGTEGIIPRSSETTLTRGFGDCKDMTTLFVDLAKQAGLDAYPVLTSSSRERVSGLLIPSAIYFDHLIACIRLPEEHCVDLTDPNATALELPGPLAGSVRLDLDERGVDAPSSLPAPQIGWNVRLEIDRELGRDGSVTERGRRIYDGAAAATLRNLLSGRTRSEQIEWARDAYRSIFGAELEPETLVENTNNTDDPLVISWKLTRPNSIPLAAGSEYADYDDFLGFVTQDLRTKNRKQPHPTGGFRYTGFTRYRLPEGLPPRLWGPSLHYASEFGTVDRTYRRTPEGVEVLTKLEVTRATIELEQLQRFNRFLDKAGADSRIWFGLGAR